MPAAGDGGPLALTGDPFSLRLLSLEFGSSL